MSTFSARNGYKTEGIQLEETSDTLKARIFTAFYREEFVSDANSTSVFDECTGIEDMMVEMGVPYENPHNDIIKERNATKLKNRLLVNSKWYTIFDFVERYLAISEKEKAIRMTALFNGILEEEPSAYRIAERKVIPITNEMELATIQEAMAIPCSTPRMHIAKALELFASRKSPDYENSVKESISAVESMCCIITKSNSTLNIAIKKLKEHGVHIHPAMEKAFVSLYGYASDENGIRHGGIGFESVPAEDAKYMLVSCSAFINYLIEKWNTVNWML